MAAEVRRWQTRETAVICLLNAITVGRGVGLRGWVLGYMCIYIYMYI